MSLLFVPSAYFCRICGRMCQLQDSTIDEQGLTVHTDCHAARMVSTRANVALQTSARRDRPIEYLQGFAVKDF
jgi:hypothetical protein